jgi:tyrosyl-tRNA synthetase
MPHMDFSSPLLSELAARGFVRDCSDARGLDAALGGGRVAVYAGFDPTADSLHVGHLVSLTLLRRFAAAGHVAIPVVGTATAMVGDPSGRTSARPMLTEEALAANVRGVEESIGRAIGGGDVRPRANGEWFAGRGWLDFLREVGPAVPVARMLALDSVRTRMADGGISFLEFSYSLMQGYDFLRLSAEHPVLLQVGGSDQWGNICMGLELIAKKGRGGRAFGLTHPLLTKSNGEKMGKSAGGAVWLNPARLDDFGFFQFWRCLDDADAPAVAKLLSDRSPAEIDRAAADINGLKEALAVEMTARVRGEAAAARALAASRGRGASAEGLPEIVVAAAEMGDLAAILVRAGLAASKSAARRLSEQGGVRVNGEPTAGSGLAASDFRDGVAVVSAGRTRHAAVRLGG